MGTGTKLLVEREHQLDLMLDAVAVSVQGGRLLIVSGEAGHGKTSLIDVFRDRLDHRFTTMNGSCDPVSVPTPFAPLYEMFELLPASLVAEIRDGERRHDVYADVLGMLEADPTVLVIEDLHWADEATMGLVRYLGRRLSRTRSILVVSYRPEEIDTAHPLLVVLADLSLVAVEVVVPALTVSGVEELAAGTSMDAEAVHAATGGNPFFVEEVLSDPDADLPSTIEAAVMAGVARLPTGSLDLLEMVALSPDGLDIALAERFSPEWTNNIDAAFRRRLLIEDRGRLRCRHDLIRLTVDQSIPPGRRRRIHRRLMEAIEESAPSRSDMARLAHHAVGAGDGPKAIEYSLAAAAFAEADGANRQSRLHYRAALSFRDEMDPETLDRALVGSAEVNCATNHLAEATAAARERIELATDDHDAADRLAWAAFMASRWGNVELARSDADRALALHEHLGPCPGAVRALYVIASLALWEADWPTASDRAAEAVEMAKAVESEELQAFGLLAMGKAEALQGRSGWEAHIQEAVRLGKGLDQFEIVCSGLNSLGFLSFWNLQPQTARERFEVGIEWAASNEMDAWYVAMAASKAGCDLSAGEWEAAGPMLERAIAWPTCASTDAEARVLLATLHCRQGDPGASGMVETALTETDRGGTYAEEVLAAILAMEAAWMGVIELEVADERYQRIRSRAERSGDSQAIRRLDLWATIADMRATPDAVAIEGDVGFWADRGFRYESLLLRTMLDDPPLADIFDWLETRDADGVMPALRRHLRARGVSGVPGTRRRTTMSNPAGLTDRELDVLGLLAGGDTNAVIADELYISEKTVGHHVSAILRKLSVENRGQAAAVAKERGII